MTKRASGNIYIGMMILTTLTLVNVAVFDAYKEVSLLVALVFVVLGFAFCRGIAGKDLVYLCVVTLYFLFSVMLTGGGLGSVVTFVVPVAMLLVYARMDVSDNAKKLLKSFGKVVIALLFAYSFLYGAHYREYSLKYINPNVLGIFVMYYFMLICLYADFSKKGTKPRIFLLFVIAFWAMYNYQSRGTAAALCIFVLLMLLPSKLYTPKRFMAVVILVVAVGTAFPFIYLHMYRSGYSLTLFGKTLYTGREELWLKMFDLLSQKLSSVVFGLGSQTVLWQYDLNVHNNFFSVIVNFGIIGYVLYYSYILAYIRKLAKYLDSPIVRKALIMFVCAVLVLGFTENTSFWSVVFPFSYIGLITANAEVLRLQGKEGSAR